MELMEAIRERKSYRRTFKPDLIPTEALKEILEAGAAAPSGCNQQTTRFIGVNDPELAHKLACIYDKPWAMTAPAAILLLTKEHVSYRGNSYHIHDYSAAAENILLAAVDKGYATTWIEGQIEGEKARQMGDLLGVPQDLTVAIYMPLGIPAEENPGVAKMSFDERAWLNGYKKTF
ncbi:MAG: nitroreductase family protein [Enterocloster asparagiformis]|nr:nitroreductase family protein [Enterocloster asparagiformis]